MRLDPSQVRSILVVRLDRMGDLLCTTPMLSAIKHLFPQARLTLVVSPYTVHLVEGSPLVDEVLVYPRKKYGGTLKERLDFLRELSFGGFDLAFGPKASLHPTQALLVGLSGAKMRVGREAKYFKRRFLHFCYNVRLPRAVPGRHETESCLDLLRALGLNPPRLPSWARIRPQFYRQVEEELCRRGLRGRPLVGIYFSNRKRRRAVPWELLCELMGRIKEALPSYEVLATFAPEDAKEIRRHLAGGHLFPTDDVQQLGALISFLDFFVTSDGGPSHLSAAVGTKTITLFRGGEEQLRTWAPWGEGHLSLLVDGSPPREIISRILSFMKGSAV